MRGQPMNHKRMKVLYYQLLEDIVNAGIAFCHASRLRGIRIPLMSITKVKDHNAEASFGPA